MLQQVGVPAVAYSLLQSADVQYRVYGLGMLAQLALLRTSVCLSVWFLSLGLIAVLVEVALWLSERDKLSAVVRRCDGREDTWQLRYAVRVLERLSEHNEGTTYTHKHFGLYFVSVCVRFVLLVSECVRVCCVNGICC